MTADPDRGLRALLERLEAAEGPSRALDGGLHRAFPPPLPEGSLRVAVSRPEPCTYSLDAVVALAERVLPGRRWAVMRWGERDGKTVYMAEVIDGPGEDCDEGPTPALALCRAIVTVKLAESGGE